MSGYLWYVQTAPVGPSPPLDIRTDLYSYTDTACSVGYSPIELGALNYANTGTNTFGPFAMPDGTASIGRNIHYQFPDERRVITIHETLYWGPTSTAWTTTVFDADATFVDTGTYWWPFKCTIFGGGGPPAVCAYGTQTKPGVTAVVQISVPTLIGLGIATGQLWILGLAAGELGTAILTNDLCGQPKPGDATIDEADWVTPDPSGIGTVAMHKASQLIRNSLWDKLCECAPATGGGPPPVGPAVTIINKPTYLTSYDSITINNTEISTTINDLWQYFLTFNIGNNNNTTIGSQIATCTCTDYKLGTDHAGLSGDGQFAVSGIHGLSVTYTTLPNRVGVELGDPDTIYTGAWINVGNDWGWQPRLWPNTTRWMVFPPDMHQMTLVGYSIPADVEATITELVAT